MDPLAIFRPYVAFNADDGGGAGPAAQGTPTAAVQSANDRIDAAVAAGLRDDGDDANGRVTDPAAGVPGGPPVAGEAPPAAGTPPAAPSDDDPLAGIDFENLNYRDGKAIEKELKTQRERYKPFEQAFKGLEDTDRQAAVEGITKLGDQAAPILGLVSGMHPNDRAVVLSAYTDFLEDPAKGAAAFRAIAESIEPSPGGTGTPPAGGGVPAGSAPPAAGEEDLDRPLSMREFQEMQQQQQVAQQQEQAVAEATQRITTEAAGLGYAPNPTDEVADYRFRELMGLVATRTNGDVKAADAALKARDQAIIDGYIASKRADAQRPAAPETGTASSGQTDGAAIPPMEKARARLDAELGPDRYARQ